MPYTLNSPLTSTLKWDSTSDEDDLEDEEWSIKDLSKYIKFKKYIEKYVCQIENTYKKELQTLKQEVNAYIGDIDKSQDAM